MLHIELTERIAATTEATWQALSDVASHVDWMRDAVAIRFTSIQREGAGTSFECDTQVGPFKLTDKMHITSWADHNHIEVHHDGAVHGTGRFTLEPSGNATLVRWNEQLRFPWFMAGPVGERVAKPVFVWLWRGNLRRFKMLVEQQ